MFSGVIMFVSPEKKETGGDKTGEVDYF